MIANVLLRRVLPVTTALVVVGVLIAVAARGAASPTGPAQLPDLVQEPPSGLVITRIAGPGGGYALGFRSAVSNLGAGPLIISGRRPGREVNTMVADQVIEHRGGNAEVVGGVGTLRYVVSPDHRHWHLLGFDRYELRRGGQRVAAVRDQKTGFCLGDRYPTVDRPRAAPPGPVYTSRCGLGEPQLLGVKEGISAGYGDDYAANLEGQYLPLRGLAAGRYVLVHMVDPDRRLRERSYANNTASLLLDLRWAGRRPQVRILRTCPNGARCRSPIG
jgi:hypothetical protein